MAKLRLPITTSMVASVACVPSFNIRVKENVWRVNMTLKDTLKAELYSYVLYVYAGVCT